jgi:hypothetical protein
MDLMVDLTFIWFMNPRSIGRLLIQRLPVPNTASKEMRPIRHFRDRVGLLRQEPPERRMMPAQLVLGAVAMLADTFPQPLNFSNELLARHLFEVCIHMLQDMLHLIWTRIQPGTSSMAN